MLREIYHRVLQRRMLVTGAAKSSTTSKMFRDGVKRVKLTPYESLRAFAK
jgi:hypothetical protein